MNTKTAKIAAAIQEPETGVAEPKRGKESSFSAQVADLQVGDTASRAVQIDGEHTLATFAESASLWRDQLRNTIAPAVKRAKARNADAEYTNEIGTMIMPGMSLYIVAVVTRVS